MDYPKEGSRSLYDYSDNSISQAGYAAMVYAALNLFGAVLALIQHFVYHRPGLGGLLYHQEANELWLQTTPFITAVVVTLSVMIAGISGLLGFFIFRRSRFAVVAMVVFVILLQL